MTPYMYFLFGHMAGTLSVLAAWFAGRCSADFVYRREQKKAQR